MNRIRNISLAALLLCSATSWAQDDSPGLGEQIATQAVFAGVAGLYDEFQQVLGDGWAHLELRETDKIWLIRSAFGSFSACLTQAPATDLVPELAQPDLQEAQCAELVVAGLEELLGPARWSGDIQAAYRPD